ncbi:hypothetical protein [Citrobacter amalonaticus]|uniref:hypothetical protein n=1 Tax=Citrobacter amalonaticus TaxID=35703 RepID=UPI00300D95B2
MDNVSELLIYTFNFEVPKLLSGIIQNSMRLVALVEIRSTSSSTTLVDNPNTIKAKSVHFTPFVDIERWSQTDKTEQIINHSCYLLLNAGTTRLHINPLYEKSHHIKD